MNLTARRLLSFPHLLVGFFVLLMLWGEYWVFDSRVASCKWDKWEKWPAGATPHHLVFVADPQLIDPHSYPDRPWLLSELTVLITDNYLRKGYRQLRTQLQPDSVFFLGDLFDGGREWKTAVGDFSDPSDMFIKDWNTGGEQPGPWQRGRKLVAGLPGNHDLGFGDEIKIPVRDRFSAFFGDGNRVDVIGNHTIVSVDTVSLSADSSDALTRADLKSIYEPANIFLQDVQSLKQKAVEKELRFWRGEVAEVALKHEVEDVSRPNLDNVPRLNPDQANGDFPTILLSHVPLYRDPGTPCGPLREHWPPLPKPAGQTEPVKPDHRNAISVSRGYQYQNVLSEEDSVKLVKSIGNVVHAFSGDDHDYCEVVHSDSKNNVREITVKSLNMAMGVPTPGFVMVSLFNPVDDHGKPLPGSPQQTLQTHLCHLPNQISTFIRYAVFGVVCLAAIVVRALLMPVLGFTPFTLAADQGPGAGGLLPTYKDKVEDDGYYAHHNSTTAASGSSQFRSSRLRSSDDLYDSGKSRSLGSSWRAASARPRTSLGLMGREVLACAWRVAWMVLLFWAYLARKG
ncbi:Oxoglutarate dehydrogenase [Verticillium dahliae VDG1]|nr:Oxoglutarate dehydrogenase [Verticillium dahliae VDG1]